MSKGPVIHKYSKDVVEVTGVVWYSGDGWNPAGYHVYVKFVDTPEMAHECYIIADQPRDGGKIIEINKGDREDDR